MEICIKPLFRIKLVFFGKITLDNLLDVIYRSSC